MIFFFFFFFLYQAYNKAGTRRDSHPDIQRQMFRTKGVPGSILSPPALKALVRALGSWGMD